MEVLYQREVLSADLMAEAMPLIDLHYAEVSGAAAMPLEIRVDMYLAMQDAGAVRVFTARLAGAMVGYALFFVQPMPQFGGRLAALEDAIYVTGDARGGGIGRALNKMAEAALTEEGVEVVYQHAPEGHGYGVLLARDGYAPIYTLYGKRLNHGGN